MSRSLCGKTSVTRDSLYLCSTQVTLEPPFDNQKENGWLPVLVTGIRWDRLGG